MVVIYAEKPGMARLFAAALGGIEMNDDSIISFADLSKNEKTSFLLKIFYIMSFT